MGGDLSGTVREILHGLSAAYSMNSALSLQIRSLCFGLGVKPTKHALFAINRNGRNVSVPVEDNPQRSCAAVLARAALVLQVHASRHIAQVCKSVVSALP